MFALIRFSSVGVCSVYQIDFELYSTPTQNTTQKKNKLDQSQVVHDDNSILLVVKVFVSIKFGSDI